MLRRTDRRAWFAATAVALLAVPTLAAPAAARQFQMSGTWLMRKGQLFVPLQFAVPQGGYPTPSNLVSMGSWTEAPFAPTATPMGGMSPLAQVVRDTGLVTATGSAPATLVVPAHRFSQGQNVGIGFSQVNLIQMTTMLQIDAPVAQASLMGGGGPGSFTWCPSNPACTAGGPVPGMGPTNNGRVIYAAGANQFGGTMQMGLRGGGVTSVRANTAPLWAAHAPFVGSGTTLQKVAVGGGANDAPTLRKVYLARGYVTSPTMAPPAGGLITAPGPFVTTMFGNTQISPSGVTLRAPAVTPGMTMTGQYTTHEGFPHTTGTVLVQQSQGSSRDQFFTVMGSDARTPLGAGNLNLVAGGLGRRNQFYKSSVLRARYAQFDKVFLTLGPPVPSLSPAGVAAAGLLILFAAGYALRRRLG